VTNQIKSRAIILAGLIGYLMILAIGYVVAMSPVPDERELTTLTGRLDSVRLWQSPKTRKTEINLDVVGGDGAAVSIHMEDYDRAELARRLTEVAARGATVTVRYRRLPFGNRGYAVADEAGVVLAFADVRRVLEAREAARDSNDRWGFLLLYGGLPPLILMYIWWRNRSAPAVKPDAPVHRDEARLAHDIVSQRTLALAMLPVVVGLVALAGVPGEVMRVLGPRPLGLPPMAAYIGLTTLALLPVAGVMWHLASVMQAIRRRSGRIPAGKWSLLIETAMAWQDHQVRGPALGALAYLAAFLLLAGVWIVAAS